jgi:hypothetical protein
LDFLVGFEPFQRVVVTPWAKKVFLGRWRIKTGQSRDLAERPRPAPGVGQPSQKRAVKLEIHGEVECTTDFDFQKEIVSKSGFRSHTASLRDS